MKFLFMAFLSLFTFVLASCQSTPVVEKQKSWSSSMQGLSDEVREILPFAYSRQQTYTPQQIQSVKDKLSKLEKKSHSISASMAQPYLGDDPLVKFSLKNLVSDVQRAQSALEVGRVKYSKGVIKTVMNHCFRCHSVNSVGGQSKWTVSQLSGLSLSPLEKSELLVATREYDKAIDILEASLKNVTYLQSSPFDYEAALKHYLVLSVRLRPNPSRAISIFKELLEMKSIPFYLYKKIDSWKISLMAWEKESKMSQKSSQVGIRSAKKMIAKARKNQSYSKDASGDVNYLRSTQILHELLKTNLKSGLKAEVYFLLGGIYEVLGELGYWSLHENYFEGCIEEKPKSRLSKRCFERLESSIYLGYSGSSGIHIPVPEKQRLESFRLKAF